MKKLIILSVILFITLFIYDLLSSKNGISGRTGHASKGCNCHGPESELAIFIVSSPSNFITYPGYEIDVTIRLQVMSWQWCGIDIAVKLSSSSDTDAGTLTPVSSNLKLMNRELTHNQPIAIVDGFVEFTFKWRAPETLGYYSLRADASVNRNDDEADNGDDWTCMTPKIIQVVEPPRSVSLNFPNAGETLCNETSYDITWSSAYVDNVKIDWSIDGGATYPYNLVSNVPASFGKWTWNIPVSIKGNNNKIKITDPDHTSIKDESTTAFTIKDKTKIVNNPENRTACLGDTVRFDASGAGENISYQWRKDSKNIPNATQDHYIINNIQIKDLGIYDVIVTGNCGNPVTSGSGILSLNLVPVISLQPKSDTVCIGTDHNIFFNIENDYEGLDWYKDGQILEKDAEKTYSFHDVQYSDEGKYYAVVYNICGVKTYSDTVTLRVTDKPEIIMQTGNKSVRVGDTCRFFVSTKQKIVQYQWRKDTTIITGAKDSVFTIKNTQFSDAGSYNCIVFNECGTDTSQTASLTVKEKGSDAILSIEQDTINLGNVLINVDSIFVFKDFIKNTGTEALLIYSMDIIGNNTTSFLVDAVMDSISLEPSQSMDFRITCTPKDTGKINAKIEFNTNASISPELNLDAFGANVEMIVFDTLNFGEIIGIEKIPFDTTINIVNKSNIPIALNSINIEGSESIDFSVNTLELPLMIGINDSLWINIIFNPKSKTEGMFKAKLLYQLAEFDLKYSTDLICNFSATSVSDEIAKRIKMYPNPVLGILTIEIPKGIINSNIEISDLSGKKIWEGKANSDSKTIDISGFPDGVYFIRIGTAMKIFVKE